jgi:hypothetical protein
MRSRCLRDYRRHIKEKGPLSLEWERDVVVNQGISTYVGSYIKRTKGESNKTHNV